MEIVAREQSKLQIRCKDSDIIISELSLSQQVKVYPIDFNRSIFKVQRMIYIHSDYFKINDSLQVERLNFDSHIFYLTMPEHGLGFICESMNKGINVYKFKDEYEYVDTITFPERFDSFNIHKEWLFVYYPNETMLLYNYINKKYHHLKIHILLSSQLGYVEYYKDKRFVGYLKFDDLIANTWITEEDIAPHILNLNYRDR